ncbi:hypothetical protein RJ640_010063 [Escallonia rubra]|uniref:Receptor ligand binding region domain-containing protein n=1 Tax=Escallonia rubra TaxID=112253 RepID=A0AA88U471_9ASTE|nr:hypothetical protein RJ640_010063 [Escallonia rubra]
MNKITVSNSKVDANLHSSTTSGGQQDIVGSTLPVSPYFIQMASDDSSRVQVMIKIIQGFGWHEVVVLRQDTVYHERFALSLQDAFLGAKIKIISTVSLSGSAKDLEIAEELDKLKAMQTRVFLVYMVPSLRSRLFLLAKIAGIMNKGDMWLIMDSLSDTFKSVQHNNLDSAEVALPPRRDSVPRLKGQRHFKTECEKLFSLIQWEKDNDGVIPKKWNVCAPKKDGFNEFVRVNKKTCKLIDGFSIEVFCASLLIFPYKVQPIFVPFANKNCEASQNYSEILEEVRQASTANLSSIFTIDQSQPEPKVIRSIGYQEGSFVHELLAKEYETHNVSLKSYTTIHQYHEALMSKSVDVIFDELPYINLFLYKHRSSYMKVGPKYERTGFGFGSCKSSPVPQRTPHLRAHTFIGLFILAGIGTIGVVLASEYALWQRGRAKVERTNVREDFPYVDNQEHPQPVFIPSDVEIPTKESDEVEENAEVFHSQEVQH